MAIDKTQKTLSERRSQIETWVASNKAGYSSNAEMALALEQAFIFGPLSENNHYLASDILALVDEINPIVIANQDEE